jgi:hypothetical protein
MRALALLLSAVIATSVGPAQGLTFTHSVTGLTEAGASGWIWSQWGSARQSLAVGPVMLPQQLAASTHSSGASLDISYIHGRRLHLLSMAGTADASISNAFGGAEGDLTSRVSTALPARLQLDLSYVFVASGGWPYNGCQVDIGADGLVEFTNGWWPTPPATHWLIADQRGTRFNWKSWIWCYGTSTGSLSGQPTLSLRILEPVQEASYGAPCGGELGCQLVDYQPYERVVVASLPPGTTNAWLVAGFQQTNLQFPGISCPLLCSPDLIVPVALRPGPNARRIVDLDVHLPPIPGQVWFVQIVGIDAAATVSGTNGIQVQT